MDCHIFAHGRPVLRGNITCNKILTEAAKDVARQYIQGRGLRDPEEAKGPPFMLPSTDPDQYSYVRAISTPLFPACADKNKWCSFCNDFGETLVLCSTCRVCACVTGPASARGCFIWDPCIDSPEFVFRCPLCTKRSRSPCVVCTEIVSEDFALTLDVQLRSKVEIPDIKQIHFRYDPAVLIISLAWGGFQTSFGTQLYYHLSRKYVGNSSSVSPL